MVQYEAIITIKENWLTLRHDARRYIQSRLICQKMDARYKTITFPFVLSSLKPFGTYRHRYDTIVDEDFELIDI